LVWLGSRGVLRGTRDGASFARMALSAATIAHAAALEGSHALVRSLGLEPALSRDRSALTVAGYASLMDEASARETTPSLSRFRYGRIDGYCRVFNLVSIVNIKRGLATGRRLATATARPCPDTYLLVAHFDMPLDELPALLARERRLRVSCAAYACPSDGGGRALLFTEYSHDEYVRERCANDAATYHEEVGAFYSGSRIYRDDLLPVPSYVLRCVRAQRRAGRAYLDNLLSFSFLGDGRTTLRAHLQHELAGPPSLPPPTADDPVAEAAPHAAAQGNDGAPWTPGECAELLEALDGVER
jgi:hypothetical protein